MPYPDEVDSLERPNPTDPQNGPDHTDVHLALADAVEALETKVGITASSDVDSHEYKIFQLTDRVTNTEDFLGNLDTQLQDVTGVVNGHSNDISAIQVENDTQESQIVSISDNVSDLSDRVTTLENTPDSVTSVFGRVGAVVAQLGDYLASLISVADVSGIFSGDTVQSALVKLSGQLVRTTTITSNATWSPNADTTDIFVVTAQAVAATTISNPSGTPVNGQQLQIRVKDDGTARALTWSGNQWRASTDNPLPTTTVANKTLYLGFEYHVTDAKWDLLALLNNF